MKAQTQNVSLTPDLLEWANKKIGAGFNNISEVIRDALRFKREAESRDYLNPAPLPPGALDKLYRRQSSADHELERKATRGSQKTLRKFKPEAA